MRSDGPGCTSRWCSIESRSGSRRQEDMLAALQRRGIAGQPERMVRIDP